MSNIGQELMDKEKDAGAKDEVINNLLNKNTMNHGQTIKPRKYSDMLIGQFEIEKVVRIEPKK